MLIIAQSALSREWWVVYQEDPLATTCQMHAGPFRSYQAAEAFLDL